MKSIALLLPIFLCTSTTQASKQINTPEGVAICEPELNCKRSLLTKRVSENRAIDIYDLAHTPACLCFSGNKALSIIRYVNNQSTQQTPGNRPLWVPKNEWGNR